MKNLELTYTVAALAAMVLVMAIIPIAPSLAQETEVRLDSADEPTRIVRRRTSGRTAAIFSVEDAVIAEGYFLKFEAVAEGHQDRLVRWSCVALERTSDCFEERLRIPYRPQDHRVVLTVVSGRTNPGATAALGLLR